MQNKDERLIDQIYHVEITPTNYVLNECGNSIRYTFEQRVNINTINLTNFSILNTFQNINQFYNNMAFEINGEICNVQIPTNKYDFWDIQDMLLIFQDQCNIQLSSFGNWTFTLTGNNNKFVQIKNSTSTPFKLVYDGKHTARMQLFKYLGFGAISKAFVIYDSIQTGSFIYDVKPSNNIYIKIRNIQLHTEIQTSLAVISINKPFQELIHYQSPFYQRNRHIINKNDKSCLTHLQISFVDDLGNILNLQNQRPTLQLILETYA